MIIIHSAEELKSIRVSCKIVSDVLNKLVKLIAPGVKVAMLEYKAEKLILERGGKPAFKGYKGYPACLCASVNEEIVHGIPGPRILKEGDIISLDMGVELDGYFGDSALTVGVGKISPEKKKLLMTAKEALYKGIRKAVGGGRLSDISNAVQSHAEKNGFSVVRDFVGHGIGSSLHEDPQIPNFGRAGCGPRLKPGMVLAIEPMVNMGICGVVIKKDKWTAVTADGKPSAHFEHTIVVTDGMPEVLTM